MSSAENIYNELKAQIRSGRLKGRLPSIREYTGRYEVSHCTVQKVLEQLKFQSYIYGIKGKGFFVNETFSRKVSGGEVVLFSPFSFFQNPFYLRLFTHIKTRLAETGIRFLIQTGNERMPGKSPRAAVFVEKIAEELPESLKIPPERTFTVNCRKEGIRSFGADNRAGARMILEYLYECGHRRIGVLARDLDINWNFFYDRYEGVREFMKAHGDCSVAVENHSGFMEQDSMERQEETAMRLLEKNHGITAVFAFTDVLALTLMRVMHRTGLLPGEDISLAGYDNRDFSGLLTPSLTTVEEPAEKIADSLAVQLQRVFSGEKIFETDNFLEPPELIVRNSVRILS
ncbi:MAG: Arabinose metabolism transcriptional repressor [Lentisphaerae bacterium ADurb.Bin242]|nr:MAG: Arabinose metabolism transcriptional repressor [Lentisphaerae bacterium ADurb.Bin242]